MTMYEHILHGCAPVPLGSYLKALGIFRLVAEQADKDATKGFWRDERFVLKTKLSEEELIAFFVEKYEPSPIISPWNAGSGFYYREGKSNEKNPETGKKIKTGIRNEKTTATKALDSIAGSNASRFRPLREAITRAKSDLTQANLISAPTDDEKGGLVRRSRAASPDSTVQWIDAAATLSATGLEFPPLLGSGGNDGNLDFSTTYVQALLRLFGIDDARHGQTARSQFEAAAFGRAACSAKAMAISQFAPQSSGGLNAGVGPSADPSGSDWDIVFSIEGTLLLAAAAARRLNANILSGGAFPFMVPRSGVSAGGAGHAAISDEASGRGEFWAPIWKRPASISEVSSLFREGRVVVRRRSARTSLDFARAISQLGVSRGIDYFDRHAFEQRNGNMYLGVALSRHSVVVNDRAKLIADLETGQWLDRISRAARDKTSPQGLTSAGRKLDDALFRLAADGSPEAVQGALIAIGRIALECARRPKLRTEDDRGRFPTTPPPRLSAEWRTTANDGSAEFALAAALAGIDAKTEKDAEGKRFYLPFRAHLAPIKAGAKSDEWSDTTESRALALWTGRDLVRDLAAIAERRLIEPQRRTFLRANKVGADTEELPLGGFPSAPLWAIGKFLVQETDDQRIADLAAGLAWVQGGALETRKNSERTDPLPFAYAALKPLFNPGGVGSDHRRIDPLPIVRLLTAGRTSDAIALAQRMARGAGLAVPFARMAAGASVDPMRLAAALLFPLSRPDTTEVADRAYPNPTDARQVEEPAHAH